MQYCANVHICTSVYEVTLHVHVCVCVHKCVYVNGHLRICMYLIANIIWVCTLVCVCVCACYRLGMEDRDLEGFLAQAGCEVHCLDPSLKQPHRQQQARLWLHRLSVDWRDPNRAARGPHHHQHASTKKLATILNDFGHREVDTVILLV